MTNRGRNIAKGAITCALTLALIPGLAACGGSDAQDQAQQTDEQTQVQTTRTDDSEPEVTSTTNEGTVTRTTTTSTNGTTSTTDPTTATPDGATTTPSGAETGPATDATPATTRSWSGNLPAGDAITYSVDEEHDVAMLTITPTATPEQTGDATDLVTMTAGAWDGPYTVEEGENGDRIVTIGADSGDPSAGGSSSIKINTRDAENGALDVTIPGYGSARLLPTR